jgi:hypothetical protein
MPNRTLLIGLLVLGSVITSPAFAWNSPIPDDGAARRAAVAAKQSDTVKVAACLEHPGTILLRYSCVGHQQRVCESVCVQHREQPNGRCRNTGKSC